MLARLSNHKIQHGPDHGWSDMSCHDLSKEVSEADRQEASELESAQRAKAKLIAGPFGQGTLWKSSLRSLTEQ